jgi:molecular chaperone GrpE
MSDKHTKDWKKFKEEKAAVDDWEDETPEKDPSAEAVNTTLPHPSYPELEEKLTLAEQQAHENWEKSVRLLAELDNVRRRSERDVANAHRYSLEKFATALLPVIDSMEQALQLAEKSSDKSMHEGMELTMKLFLDVLKKFQVQQIDPLGEAFDPHQHEAISIQESAEVPPNSVLLVVQKGYTLSGDRVIRPARVIVSKA